MLSLVDPYGETILDASHMPDLLADIKRLQESRLLPVERRGLARLEALAKRCRDEPQLTVWFDGD